jgi:hypothetical protein
MPLPPQPYEYTEWKKPKVSIDYHVDVDGHYYSVPYRPVREKVDVRITSTYSPVLRQPASLLSFGKGDQVLAAAVGFVHL